MPLINCKIELKLNKNNDNENVTSDNIIFTIKDTKLHVPAVTLLAKDNQKLSKLLSKVFERSGY